MSAFQPDLFGVELPQGAAMTVTKTADVSACQLYRWTLTRSWGDGPKLCWVMLNPSTADHLVDDPTIRRVTHFTRFWGYDGFTVVNLYPFRSPQPADCRRWAEWTEGVGDVLQQNVTLVAQHAKSAAMVVGAWGNQAWDAAWIESVVAAIHGGVGPLPDIYCLGTTKWGAPTHPGARGGHRVPDDQQPVLWRSKS